MVTTRRQARAKPTASPLKALEEEPKRGTKAPTLQSKRKRATRTAEPAPAEENNEDEGIFFTHSRTLGFLTLFY
jgi:hypothetical protein